MKRSIWSKTIPTWAGLLLLLIAVVSTIFLARTGIIFPIRATQDEEPQKVTLSNITDTSITISYNTSAPVEGSITFGESPEKGGTVAFDERDTTGTPQKHVYHHITLRNLKPITQYFITIISGSQTYTNQGQPYTVTTGTAITTSKPQVGSVTGKVLTDSGTFPSEGIVYIKEANSQTISGLLSPDGSYSIQLDGMRSTQNNAYSVLSDTSPITVIIDAQRAETTVETTIANAHAMSPVTIAQKYDFTSVEPTEMPIASSSGQPSQSQSTFPQFSTLKAVNPNPQILSPKKDQAFADQQPEFTGTAPPNRTVEIIINSTATIKTTVLTDKSGKWTYRPSKKMEAGTHTIQITTRDEAGILRTITQSFIVQAEGSQFTDPSVAPPSPTPTTAIATTPTLAPTVAPTTAISPSTTPIISVTQAVTPTLQPSPTLMPTVFITQVPIATQPPPPSISPMGSETVVIAFSLAGFAIIVGTVLFFFTHVGF